MEKNGHFLWGRSQTEAREFEKQFVDYNKEHRKSHKPVEFLKPMLQRLGMHAQEQATFKVLAHMLRAIVDYEQQHPNSNKMNAKKLALCMGRIPRVFQVMIESYDLLFY